MRKRDGDDAGPGTTERSGPPTRSAQRAAPPELSTGWRSAALALLAAGIAARCAFPAWIDFGGEQIEAVVLAWRSLHETPALRGLRVSNGIDMPPLYVWLVSIPVLFSTAPVVVTAFVTAVNLGALALLFALVRRAAGERAAWFATILLAGSTWAILFSRRVWAQDFLFPFAVATWAAALHWRSRPTLPRAAAAGLAAGLLLQLYPSAWFLVPPLAAWLVLVRAQPAPAHVAAAAGAALLVWLPHLAYRAQSGFADVESMLAMRGTATEARAGFLESLAQHARLAVQIAGGTDLTDLLGKRVHAAWSELPGVRVLDAIAWVTFGGIALAILLALRDLPRRVRVLRASSAARPATNDREALAVAMTLALLGVVGANALLRLPPMPHYSIAAYPAAAVLAALALDRACRTPRAAWLALGAVGLATCAHVGSWFSIRSWIAREERPVIGRYSPVYALVREGVDRDLATALDDAVEGRVRRAHAAAGLRARFEASADVRLAWDPRADAPPIDGLGCVEVERTADGAHLRLAGPPHWFEWPAFELAPDERAVARLAVTMPLDSVLLTFVLDEAGAARRDAMFESRVERGAHVAHFELPPGLARGRLRTRVSVEGVLLTGLDVRAVAP